MDKKQRFSWGVSFGSLALVAGMVSYLGLSNGNKTNNQLSTGQKLPSNQQSQSGQDLGQNFDNSLSGNNSSQSGLDDGSSNNNSDQNSQFSNGGFSSGNNHGFDTTTGGT